MVVLVYLLSRVLCFTALLQTYVTVCHLFSNKDSIVKVNLFGRCSIIFAIYVNWFKGVKRTQKKKEFPACLFVCICWCMYVDMFMCVLCVSACFLHLFCCPLVSPKQGKRVIITSSEYISPSFSLEQTNPHHTHLLHTSSLPPPRGSARSVRVWNVKGRTLSFKLSQPPVSPALVLPHALAFSCGDSTSCLFLTLFLCRHLSFSSSLSSLFLRWACCCRLQVRGTPQPMKNECLCSLWLWWTSPCVSLSLFSIWLPPKKTALRHTYTQFAHTKVENGLDQIFVLLKEEAVLG